MYVPDAIFMDAIQNLVIVCLGVHSGERAEMSSSLTTKGQPPLPGGKGASNLEESQQSQGSPGQSKPGAFALTCQVGWERGAQAGKSAGPGSAFPVEGGRAVFDAWRFVLLVAR